MSLAKIEMSMVFTVDHTFTNTNYSISNKNQCVSGFTMRI